MQYVSGIKNKSDFKVKKIIDLQKEQIDDEYINLAKWMSNRYFCNVYDCLKLMLPPGRTAKNIEKRINDKKKIVYCINKPIDEIKAAIDNSIIKTQKQRCILEYLIRNDKQDINEIQQNTNGTQAVLNTLIKNGYVKKEEAKIERDPVINKKYVKTVDYSLTNEQKNAFDSIGDNGEYLIYGVTGSGKTEIYMQLIEKKLKEGKSSIMLVPEISLTPQTIERFVSRFGNEKIAVLHSRLSTGERYDEWNKIKEGKAKIVIGARSALFAPAKNLGLVVIDEEHDSSYQSESNPRYSAIEVAEELSKRVKIPLVLGSATPDLTTFYKAKNDKIKLLTLTKRANNSQLPDVEVIDLRDELTNGNKSMISRRLKEEIDANLAQKKQTILYFNRRGFSSYLMCAECGYTFKCRRCDITLTYHKNEEKVKCHYCGYEEKVPKECPNCKSNKIKFFGAGTQKLEEEVKKIFPKATTIRMDIDTVSKKNSHEDIINKFKNENINILIGTQMVVKGHHFPNVTLVGVIFADNNLNIGDYRANERTFQTLTQVAGRAGRENEKGKVIIQTYNPENYAIEYSKDQNYDEFYDTEITIRKALKYPPFCDIIVIDINSTDAKELKNIAKKLHVYLKNRVINEKFGVLLYSPVPCPIDKIKNRYRMRILIKCLYDEKMHDLLEGTLKEFEKMKSKTARMGIQINPYNMM